MSKKNRNKELFEKGLISKEVLKKIDKELYEILIEKNKKELDKSKKEFETTFEKAQRTGKLNLL